MKAGIIGLGKMGLSHCSILGAHPDVNEVFVCDSSKLILSAFKQHSNFKCYSEYDKMIKENNLDFVVIATPTIMHFDIAILALKSNCHVFCEKPLVLSLQEGEILKNLAIEKMLVNQVGFHNRFVGTFQTLRDYAKSGIIGKIYHIIGKASGPVIVKRKGNTWRSNPTDGGGCLYDYASHVINLLQYVVGSPHFVGGTILKKVFSSNVEDAVYASLFYANEITGQLAINWSDITYRKMSTQVEILGTKGKIVSDSQECQLYLNEEPQVEKLSKGWNSFWITDQTKPVSFNLRGEEYSSQIDYFIHCINNKEMENINSFEEALQTDKTIEMLRQDAKV